MKSKILIELFAALNFAPKAGQALQDFAGPMAVAGNALSDADYDKLSDEAAEYLSAVSGVHNANIQDPASVRAFPEPPDAEKEDPPARTRTRTAASAPADVKPTEIMPTFKPKLKDVVTVTNKRGKVVTGIVVELSSAEIVLDVNGQDEAFDRDRLESIVLAGQEEPEAEEVDNEPCVGDTVQVVTLRDKIVVGVIVEIDDKEVVIKDVAGETHDFGIDRLKSVTVKVKAKEGAKKEDPPATTSRTRAGTPAPAPASEEEGKRTRSGNPRGISVGGRIRELIANDLKITIEAVGKQLKKEEIDFREPTLVMIYKDTMTVIDLLKKAGKLK